MSRSPDPHLAIKDRDPSAWGQMVSGIGKGDDVVLITRDSGSGGNLLLPPSVRDSGSGGNLLLPDLVAWSLGRSRYLGPLIVWVQEPSPLFAIQLFRDGIEPRPSQDRIHLSRQTGEYYCLM